MAILEEHFTGFDPRSTPSRIAGCPIFNACAYVIWFEAYGFTAWRAGFFRNTGIGYLYAYQGFDICGNMLRFPPAGCDFPSFGFGGNRTVSPFETATTFNEWLAIARAKVRPLNLPTMGTIQFTDAFHKAAGYRA